MNRQYSDPFADVAEELVDAAGHDDAYQATISIEELREAYKQPMDDATAERWVLVNAGRYLEAAYQDAVDALAGPVDDFPREIRDDMRQAGEQFRDEVLDELRDGLAVEQDRDGITIRYQPVS